MASYYNMFSGPHAESAGDNSDSDTATIIVNGAERIRGANGTFMLATTGNECIEKILDVYSRSTRIVPTDLAQIEHFMRMLDECLNFDDSQKVMIVKYFCAHAFYLRDVKEKGERTLFHITFIRIWKLDSELAKLLMKFIVGTDGTEYFGSWKDLKQILELAKTDLFGISDAEYDQMYFHFQRFEGSQLSKDWSEYIACKRSDGPKAGTKPNISLCAKWTVGASKHFDEELYHLGMSYVGNFCKTNADLLAEMTKLAHGAGPMVTGRPTNPWKRKVKPTDYLGLQRVYRLVKSSLNTELDTSEQKMCLNEWSRIRISAVPARTMTKVRRAFMNEKAVRDRKAGTYDTAAHQFGDRFDLPLEINDYIHAKLNTLSCQVAQADYVSLVAEFWQDPNVTIAYVSHPKLRIVLDRIICRFNVSSTILRPGAKSIHGARSDINDLVIAALKIPRSDDFDPSRIAEWAGSNPERALLHTQIQDKIHEISASIATTLGADDTAGDSDQLLKKNIRINLKRAVGLYDVSASMNGAPLNVCIGLAYCIGRLTCEQGFLPIGITFDTNPKMFQLPINMDFASALHYIKGQSWGGSTNFVAAFRLILGWAVEHHLTQTEIPESLIVISDMQFNVAQTGATKFETMYETMKREFNDAGYELPLLVFWNVNGSYNGQSVNAETCGVVTISGYDPALFKTLSECGSIGTNDVSTGAVVMTSPLESMLNSLSRDRFLPIHQVVTDYYEAMSASVSVSANVTHSSSL